MKKKLIVIIFAIMLFAVGMNNADAATIRVYDEEGGNLIATEYTTFNSSTVNFEEPSKENHIFEGWVTDGWTLRGPFGWSEPNSNGITIDGNSLTVSRRIVPQEAYIDVYATWTRVYTITYILDGGEAEGNPESYTEYDEVSITDPTKDGYEFLGWIDEEGENLGKELFFEEGTTGDKILTAAWKKNAVVETIETAGAKKETKVVTKNPKTGDNILLSVSLAFVGLLSLIGLNVLDKKSVNEN